MNNETELLDSDFVQNILEKESSEMYQEAEQDARDAAAEAKYERMQEMKYDRY
jgi:predicted ArsR family transcriptional regulator